MGSKKKNNFLEKSACFDLQFRRDVRKKRVGSPVYYSWKIQFALAVSMDKKDSLQNIKETLGCGKIYRSNTQLRYSVQGVNDITGKVIPFFKNYPLKNKKRRDFELWAEAAEIIQKNKGKPLLLWSKEDFQYLISLQKKILDFKTKKFPSPKWTPEAESIAKFLCPES